MSEYETYIDATIVEDKVTKESVVLAPPNRPDTTLLSCGPDSYQNIQMEVMLNSLSTLLDRSDIIGYAAARNTRILRAEAQEYLMRREELIAKYGKPQTDADGNETGVFELKFNTPEFHEYEQEIGEWARVEHQPNLFKIPAKEVIGKLTGGKILEIDWMLDWSE